MKRNHEVKLKFTKQEKENIKKKAEKLGLKPTQYIRMLSLNVEQKQKKK